MFCIAEILQLALSYIFNVCRESEITVCHRVKAPLRGSRSDCPHASVEIEHRDAIVKISVIIICDIVRKPNQDDLIMVGTEEVGVIRIVDKKDGSRKRISPLWIMPAYRGKGYAQLAMIEAERIHGSDHWSLDTILQEKGNLHLYEKMGYHQTGKIEKINEKMDIVFYEKDQ